MQHISWSQVLLPPYAISILHTPHLYPIHHSFLCSSIALGVPSVSLICPQTDYNIHKIKCIFWPIHNNNLSIFRVLLLTATISVPINVKVACIKTAQNPKNWPFALVIPSNWIPHCVNAMISLECKCKCVWMKLLTGFHWVDCNDYCYPDCATDCLVPKTNQNWHSTKFCRQYDNPVIPDNIVLVECQLVAGSR